MLDSFSFRASIAARSLSVGLNLPSLNLDDKRADFSGPDTSNRKTQLAVVLFGITRVSAR